MGGKSSTSTSTTSIPPQVLAQYSAVNARANDVANTPFQQYSTDPNAFVAPINTQQYQGIGNINANANTAAPYMGTAGNLELSGAQGVNPGQANVNQFLSPYLGTAYAAQLAGQQFTNAKQASGVTGNAIMSGAFGGDRAGVAQANLAYDQNLANSQANANMLNAGYQNAAGNALTEQNLQTQTGLANQGLLQSAGNNLSNIGAAAQTAGLQGGQAQLAAGTAEQQTQQAGQTALYNQFLQQQSYPFQTTQFLANIAEGIGAQSGSTTSTTQPSSFFSDENLKEDIQEIGKTFDGQKIVKFRYKGKPGVQVGLLAQDVEKHHPDAVGHSQGYKTVDYDAATKDAAKRGHYYKGGLVSQGGSVGPEGAGLGFADGGGIDWNALLAAHQAMYPGVTGGVTTSGTPGHPGYVPSANLPVGHLQANAPLMSQQPTLASDLNNVAQMTNTAKTLYGAGQGVSKGLGQAADWAKGQYNQMTAAPSANNVSDFSVMDYLPDGAARGGVIHRDTGGVIPYENAESQTGSGLMIPDDHTIAQPASHSAAPSQQPSGLSQVGQLVGIASAVANMFNKGGVVRGYADGGDPTVADDVPDVDPSGVVPTPEQKAKLDAITANLAQPQDVRSMVDAEADRAGIPRELAHGLVGQESSYNPATVGKSGEVGLTQVLPSTAKAPGYGMEGVDPASLSDPQANLRFGLNYLKARGAAAGVKDWNDPEQQALALKAYNGGGDPNYVQHVQSRMGVVPSSDTGADMPASASTSNAAPTGLVSRTPDVMHQYNDDKNSSFMGRNQDWLVPLLTGLGTMASSNSRYLGSALLQGVAGGAGAYENVQNEIANRAKVAAESSAIPARVGVEKSRVDVDKQKNALEAMRYLTSNYKPFTDPATNQRMWRDDVSGSIMNDADHMAKVSALSGVIGGVIGGTPAHQGNVAPSPATNVAPVTPVAQQTIASPVKPQSPVATGGIDESKIASPTDRPSVLKAQIEALDKSIQSAQSQGNLDQVTQLQSRRQALQEHADQIINGALVPMGVDNQPVEDFKKIANDRAANAQYADAVGKARSQYYDEANRFVGKEYPESANLLNSMASIYRSINTNRATPDFANAVGVLRSIPGISKLIPEGLETTQGGYDAAQKAAITQAFTSIADNQAQKAPKSALTEAIQTVANPTMSPEARYSVITRKLGESNRQKAMYEDFLTQNATDPARFAVEWNKDPKHSLDNYIKEAQSQTPAFKDQAPLPGNNPPEPNPPAPPATQREPNKIYHLPKGDYRWTGTGWAKP